MDTNRRYFNDLRFFNQEKEVEMTENIQNIIDQINLLSPEEKATVKKLIRELKIF
jgi:hypothetical protein